MPSESSNAKRCRLLVVEDEALIGLLLEDMLNDLGHGIEGMASDIEAALRLAREAAIDAAILDVNVNGQDVAPVADILVDRGIPFVFVTGYGQESLPKRYRDRPILQKPFQIEALALHLQDWCKG